MTKRVVFLSCLLSAACVDFESESESETESVAVTEQALSESWQGQTIAATVGIYFLDPVAGYLDGACTATVLTEHWLLTAAHCIDGFPSNERLWVQAADVTGATTNTLYDGTFQAFEHPNRSEFSWDIGLIYLRDGAISNFAPRGNLFSDSAHPWYGSYRLNAWVEGAGRGGAVGAGVGCQAPSGTMRRNQLLPDGSSSLHVISDREIFCDGDSGGAWMFNLYDNGWRMVQFGVIKGIAWGINVGGTWTTKYGFASALPVALPWIEQTMRNRMGLDTQLVVDDRAASGYRYRTYREQPMAPLTVSISGSGSVAMSPSGRTCSASCIEPFLPGTSVQVTATPQNGYRFSGWTGCPAPSGTSCYLTMDQRSSISVRFNLDSSCHVDQACYRGCLQDCPRCTQACRADCTVCP